MSLSQALNIALSGLQATTLAMGYVGNNVSNANSPGFTQKTVNYGTLVNGQAAGVQVTGYTRAVDAAISASYNVALSNSSFYSTQYGYLQQVQSILDSSSQNPTLSSDISAFQSDLQNLSAQPESSVMQQTVISDGNRLAKDIQAINTGVTNLLVQATNDVTTTVATLNADLKKVQTLNTQVTEAAANNQPTGDLEDQRDVAIQAVAAITNVTIMHRNNGQIALYTPGGTALVDNTAQTFTYNGSGISNSAGQDVTGGLLGGSLEAQLNFISSTPAAAASSDAGTGVIAKIQSQLQSLVTALAGPTSAFVTSYANAVTQSTAAGGTQNGATLPASFFTATFTAGVPSIGSFGVSAPLLNGTGALPQTGTLAIANSFTSIANYSASGLSVSNVTYSGLAQAILSNFQTAANSLKSTSADAETQQTFYKNALSNATGVNTDSQLVLLTTLQNSYAASAHIITTIENMFASLEGIGTGS